MDKSWVSKPRNCLEYKEGILSFMQFAINNGVSSNGKLRCPCLNCTNVVYQSLHDLYTHCICDGFMPNYTFWNAHGEVHETLDRVGPSLEEETEVDVMNTICQDALGYHLDINEDDELEEIGGQSHELGNEYFNIMRYASKELYPGCAKHSKLSVAIHLFHMKNLNGWSDKSVDMLIEFIKELLPDGHTMPSSFYETKKMIKKLGLGCKKISACPNDCVLYRKEYATENECPKCHESRWKNEVTEIGRKRIPAKVVRYFPLIPRLQRLFMSTHTAEKMRWHDEHRTKDGTLRHPADAQAWKHMDSLYPNFSKETRNIRLGLASDGFNPFSEMGNRHSTWPVVLIPYNLPPALCMKPENMILTLLIDGPEGGPGNKIDTYLQLVVDELKELWEDGVNTYDASKKDIFKLRALLLWTINDFPAYAMLSGWSTKGKLACPICNTHTCSQWLYHCKKFCYMGHRRFLSMFHAFRRQTHTFNGKEEHDPPPIPWSGVDVDTMLSNHSFEDEQKNTSNKRKRKVASPRSKKGKKKSSCARFLNWKKKSVFFELPYWKHNLLRHNLDVMHIEKNVCVALICAILYGGKNAKENLSARRDLQDLGIRPDFYPCVDAEGKKAHLAPPSFLMSKKNKALFFEFFKNIKVPDGYASNISKALGNEKISGLKSHDFHILMQQFIPLIVRKTLPKKVSKVVIELCRFFNKLSASELKVDDLKVMDKEIVITLCNMERIFFPSFFDVMIHLVVHLASEALICGPVYYRWMYPIERFLFDLKSHLRNKSCLEGSIVEGYLVDECMTFCSRYLQNIETKFNRSGRNDSGENGRPLGGSTSAYLEDIELEQAHRYVLFNTPSIDQFVRKHRQILSTRSKRSQTPRELEKKHINDFPNWFKEWVTRETSLSHHDITNDIRRLSWGPHPIVKRYSGYIINGLRFHTKDREKKRVTQNSGVIVKASTSSFSSSKDKHPITCDVVYYGILEDIIELYYADDIKHILFKCKWVVPHRGVKVDDFGFTQVNFNHLLSSTSPVDEPYIFATQAQQIFYVDDLQDRDWCDVIKHNPRGLFEMSFEWNCGNNSDTFVEEVDNESYIGIREDGDIDVLDLPEGTVGLNSEISNDLSGDACEELNDSDEDSYESIYESEFSDSD